MAIKQTEPLSRADFDEAMVRLRLSVSEVAKETGIPRTYLSEYRNGDRKLRPENLAKLRDYFEAKGIEFEDEAPADGEPAAASAPQGITPHPRLVAVQSVRFCFPLADTVPDDVVAKVMDQIEEGDARLLALFKEQIEREDGFFSEGEFTDEFTALLQEAFSILASNYVLSRMLRGWSAVSNRRSQVDLAGRHGVGIQRVAEFCQRCGSNSSIRLAG